MRQPSSGKFFEIAVWVVAAAAAGYLLLAGYCGYAVGRAMRDAKASNPLVGMVANAVGREGSERYAISKAHVPAYLVDAPTFWIALRMNE
ncbi:MAG TPA: hypothetical protein VJP76_07185 [Candidatus Tumulicola sp.]|nr:hypothetical protein [Candidatus Tumulicola sp.]